MISRKLFVRLFATLSVVIIGALAFSVFSQDEAFFSWFARQKPSIGIKGRYSYLGTFTGLSKVC